MIPHICMDLSFIIFTLCVLEQINPPVHFLSRDLFKIPLMIYSEKNKAIKERTYHE